MICPNPSCGNQGRALTGTVMGVPENPHGAYIVCILTVGCRKIEHVRKP